MLHRALGDLSQAEGHLRAAVKDVAYVPALLELGSVYEELDRPKDALLVYQVLVREGGSSPEATLARERVVALRKVVVER